MCIIPYGTQQGEISFCAYNTGVGWRQIVEHMHKSATTAQWYKERGKHKVYANGKDMPLPLYDDPITTKIPLRERDGKLPIAVANGSPAAVGAAACGNGCG
jgi:hypothetical protein